MHTPVRSAHAAYPNAADLAPLRGAPAPEPVDVAGRWVSEQASERVYIRDEHLVALGGTAFFMVAGAICGILLSNG